MSESNSARRFLFSPLYYLLWFRFAIFHSWNHSNLRALCELNRKVDAFWLSNIRLSKLRFLRHCHKHWNVDTVITDTMRARSRWEDNEWEGKRLGECSFSFQSPALMGNNSWREEELGREAESWRWCVAGDVLSWGVDMIIFYVYIYRIVKPKEKNME